MIWNCRVDPRGVIKAELADAENLREGGVDSTLICGHAEAGALRGERPRRRTNQSGSPAEADVVSVSWLRRDSRNAYSSSRSSKQAPDVRLASELRERLSIGHTLSDPPVSLTCAPFDTRA